VFVWRRILRPVVRKRVLVWRLVRAVRRGEGRCALVGWVRVWRGMGSGRVKMEERMRSWSSAGRAGKLKEGAVGGDGGWGVSIAWSS